MLSHTSTVITTLQNVQLFMTKNAAALGTLNTSASRKALDDLESRLSEHATNQTNAVSNTKAAVARQRVLRSTLLVKYLRPISAIAEAQLNQSPDFLALKLPKSLRSTQQLLAAAASMGAAAANYSATFIAAGMAPTFINDLQKAAADLKASSAQRGDTNSTRIGATSGLRAATSEAHKVVKALDALIQPMLANNTALLSQWKATKRFTGRPTAIASATIDSAATVSVTEAPTQAPTEAPTDGTTAVPSTPAASATVAAS